MPSIVCLKIAQGINKCLHETVQGQNPLNKPGGNVKVEKKPATDPLEKLDRPMITLVECKDIYIL